MFVVKDIEGFNKYPEIVKHSKQSLIISRNNVVYILYSIPPSLTFSH